MDYVNSYRDLVGDYFGDNRVIKQYTGKYNGRYKERAREWSKEYYRKNKKEINKKTAEVRTAKKMYKLDKIIKSGTKQEVFIALIKKHFGSIAGLSRELKVDKGRLHYLIKNSKLPIEVKTIFGSKNIPVPDLELYTKKIDFRTEMRLEKKRNSDKLRDRLIAKITDKYGSLKEMAKVTGINGNVISVTINNYEKIMRLLDESNWGTIGFRNVSWPNADD